MKERSKINSDTYDSIFGDRLYDRYRQNVEVVRTALDGLSETQEQIMTRGKEVFEPFSKGSTGLANLDKVAKTWETVADSVYNMQVQTRHSTVSFGQIQVAGKPCSGVVRRRGTQYGGAQGVRRERWRYL